MQKVNTYFAIKYGIPLGQGNGYVGFNGNNYNYVSATGKVLWDATANATNKYNIAGIGYEKCQGLTQKQSQSIQSGFQPIISLAGIETTNAANAAIFTADSSFLIWGNDIGAAAFATTITPPASVSANNRFTRIWKVQETGEIGTVKVAIPPVGTGGTVYLLHSADATFDATDTWIPLSNLTIGGINYLAAEVDFNNGDYFTFATYLAAPGCVAANLNLWLKADSGTSTTTDGQKVANWDNIGSLSVSLIQPTAAKQPTYRKNQMNFNRYAKLTQTCTLGNFAVHFLLHSIRHGKAILIV